MARTLTFKRGSFDFAALACSIKHVGLDAWNTAVATIKATNVIVVDIVAQSIANNLGHTAIASIIEAHVVIVDNVATAIPIEALIAAVTSIEETIKVIVFFLANSILV